MKDIPVELPPELHLPVIMVRADPRDALVSTRFGGLDALPAGALDVTTMLPAAGQGALGIECRRGDDVVEALIAPLACPRATSCVLAERAFNRKLEGGCQVPIAAHATLEGEALGLRGLVASLDGARVLRSQVRGSAEDVDSLGTEAAAEVLEQGAGEILSEIYATAGQ